MGVSSQLGRSMPYQDRLRGPCAPGSPHKGLPLAHLGQAEVLGTAARSPHVSPTVRFEEIGDLDHRGQVQK